MEGARKDRGAGAPWPVKGPIQYYKAASYIYRLMAEHLLGMQMALVKSSATPVQDPPVEGDMKEYSLMRPWNATSSLSRWSKASTQYKATSKIVEDVLGVQKIPRFIPSIYS